MYTPFVPATILPSSNWEQDSFSMDHTLDTGRCIQFQVHCTARNVACRKTLVLSWGNISSIYFTSVCHSAANRQFRSTFCCLASCEPGSRASSTTRLPLQFSNDVSKMSGTVKCKGAASFRLRVACCMLSCRRLVISKIREDDRNPGISDYESSFLRLVEKIVNGAKFTINDTGTQVSISPGLLTGGQIQHDCGRARGIGYFIEGILPLLPFCKHPLLAEFTGITNNDLDLGVDRLKYSTLELFRYFGVEEGQFDLQIISRGALPGGGGKVRLRFVPVRSLRPVQLTKFGMVKKIRGYAYATKVSPQFCNRMITSGRALLNEFIPDVHVISDHSRGAASGASAGYAICLIAETTEQIYLSTEITASKVGWWCGPGRKCVAFVLHVDW